MSAGKAGAVRAWMGEGLVEGPADEPRGRFPRRPSAPAALIVAVVAWALLAAGQWAVISSGDGEHPVPEGLASGRYEVELLEDAKLGSFGYSVPVAVTDAFGVRREVQATYSARDIEGDPRLLARQRISATISFSELKDATYARYAAKGICARAKLTKISVADGEGVLGAVVGARMWARDLLDGFESRGAALVRAVLIGDRSKLEGDGLYDDVKTVGLAHMVAVSGAHLSVVAALVGALLARARVPRLILCVVLCIFYMAYAVFTGLSAPVVRAALMAGVVVNSAWSARRASSLSALGVCVCALLAVKPSSALSLSLFLSAASTLGIVVLSPLLQAWFDLAFSGHAKKLSEACALTTAANVPMFPVTACVFSRVPLLSPVANVIAAPVLTAVIGGGLACLGLAVACPSLGALGLGVVVAVADALCIAVSWLARIPFASIPCSMSIVVAAGLSTAVFVALWLCWPRPTKAKTAGFVACSAALAAALAVVSPMLSPDEIVAMDVGQGDAILIKSRGASLLVDTGNQDSLLAAALGRARMAHLDGVVVTHHDDDHCASLNSLSSNIAGSSVYVAADTLTCGCDSCSELLSQARSVSGREAHGLAVGDAIQVGNFTCRVVWPAAFADGGGNADSLCLLVSYQGETRVWTALLTGDAEADQLQTLCEGSKKTAGIGSVDVLKAGHHGSRAGMNERLAQELSPEIALVSCGANNRYGHPAPSTVEAFEDAGAAVFRTDESGDIACVFSRDGIQVRTQRVADLALE